MVSINKYNSQTDSLDKLVGFAHLAYQTNKNFFGQDVREVVINFLYSRDEMNQVLGRETPEWLVGNTKNNTINIFSPAVFDKVSSHPASDFMPVFTHETAHVYTTSIFGSYKNQYPIWFREGIAGCVAKQDEKYKFKKFKTYKFSEITYSKDWNKRPNYPQAFLFTKYLIDKYDKNIILDLLKSSCQEGSLFNFQSVFGKITGSDFSEVTDNWLKTVNY